jgi:hypothetical protein
MQILFRGRAAGKLEDWERRPFARGTEAGPAARDHRDRYERIVATEKPGDPEPGGPHQRIAAALLRYEIFPSHLVRGVLRRAPLQRGDTVGILYHTPLFADLFFAARVIDCFDERRDADATSIWHSGFTYRTLEGHPELGEETFSVETNRESGAIMVALRSWSRPGTQLARAFAPVVRRLQIHASHAALDHLQSIARGARGA